MISTEVHKFKLMQSPEKNTESFIQTIMRTIITATIIASILTLFGIIPYTGNSKLAAFGIMWLAVYCIVFGGHWLELFFINYVKFIIPGNILLLYSVRIFYWFFSAIPLFALANLAINLTSEKTMLMGKWWTLGLIYIGIQLIINAIMQLRMKKSFYNGVY